MIAKPELSEETKRRANEVYRYLRTEARPVTKEELCSFLGWEYNSSSERRVRDLISIIAKRKPIIATSDQRGYKVPTVAKWWKGECFPRANLWKPLAEKLGVTIPELLEIFGTEG